jgi:hypothetical protein
VNYHVLDRVKVSGIQGVPTQVGVVTQVRRYPTGDFRYSVGVADDGYIVDERNLSPTDEREPIEQYLPPGDLFPWDEVTVRATGTQGVIDGWFDDEGVTKYSIWIPSTGTSEVCAEGGLVWTGRSSMRRSGKARSTRVSVAGEPVGVVEYEIVEDLMDVVADARSEDPR